MKYIYIILASLIVVTTSCKESSEGFLDAKGKDVDDRLSVFTDSIKTMGAHAALFWQLGRVTMSPHWDPSNLSQYKDYEGGTDNSRGSYFRINEITVAFTKGDFSQTKIKDGGPNASYADFRRGWQEAYQTILRCNIFLANYDLSPITDKTKERLVTEARFIRAFFYFHLLRQYGGISLMGDQVADPFNAPQIARSSIEDVVTYLETELAYIIINLPVQQIGADYGRPTKVSALALLTELHLLAASPLYNGQNIGAGANRLLVGYDDYQKERWTKVVNDAEEIFKFTEYGLETGDATKPGDGFYKSSILRMSKERLWFWLTVSSTAFPQSHLLPPSRNAKAKIFPYHELTEAFPMKNGLPIIDAKSGYDKANPYDNRDPRFGYTIIYNGAKWIKTAGNNAQPVYTHRDDPKDSYPSNTPTGYFFRNGADTTKMGNANGDGQGLAFIKYSHVMFAYAEALTELDVNANRAKIEDQLFKIRDRAGIEPGNDNRYGIPENMDNPKMIEFIINERRIEFANQCGNRFWDLRRRKLYENLNEIWTSAAVWTKDSEWAVVPIEQHFFSTKMYFNAIPQREINASRGALIQNPGW